MLGFVICGWMLVSNPTNVSADIATFDIDVTEVGDVEGDTIRVFGTMTLDPDIADTSNAIFSSTLFILRENGAAVELTDFENMGGEFIDFVQVNDELFVKGLGQNNEFMRWTGPGQTTFFFGSGPNNDAVFAESGDDFWARTNENGNGYRLGSVAAVPEPGSLSVCLALAGIAFTCRRRRG